MSDKLFAQCIQDQDSELLQHYINDGLLDIKVINIVKVLYFLHKLFWKENQKINIDFFECLLKNGILLDSHLSKEHKTTAIVTIIRDLEFLYQSHEGEKLCACQSNNKNLEYFYESDYYKIILKLLIEYGANPNTILENSNFGENITLLEYAYLSDKKLFKLLVEKGADINIQYISKSTADLSQTPLSNAIDDQNIEIIKLLIEHNVEIDFLSYYALFQGFESYYLWSTVDKIKYNNVNTIKKSNLSLIDKIKAFENKTEKIKIDRKFDDLFEILKFLSDKIHINYTVRHKNIFDLAIEAGDYKIVEFFLENKVDELKKFEIIDTHNKLKNESQNIYDFAHSMIDHQDKRKLENLEETIELENKPYYKKYHEEQENKPSVFKALLERDIEQFKNTITKEIAQFLPLTDLLKEDYPLEFMQVAIDNGSDINFQDNNGKTVLILACEANKFEIIKYLLTKNIDLNIEDLNLKKAIQYIKDYELVKLFLVALKSQHTPQKLVKILSNFTIDTPFKLTTHLWEDPKGELFEKYNGFDGFMNAVRKHFENMSSELIELSPNLHKKIYAFLIDENPDLNYNWCTKTPINIGWSNLEGLKEHCNCGKLPKDFKLPKSIFIGRKQITTFGEIVDLFKQEIEVRAGYQITSLPNVEFSRRDFYTDTQNFSTVIAKIFAEMNKREEYPNIEVTNKELDDRSIEIRITQVGSFGNKNSNEMLQEIKNGDFSDLEASLTNLCDWSIESSFENENFRVNFLHSNNIKDIEILPTKPKGFTHILRFYK
jgi:ankyrin repeat protein